MPIYNNLDYLKISRNLPKNWKKDKHGIPYIKHEELNLSIINTELFLINPKNLSDKISNKKNKIIHSFVYDDVLNKEYNNPYKWLNKVSSYYAATSPDFSMHDNMQEWQIIEAIAKSRWLGAFLQSYGIKVFPTVGWTTSQYYDICFAGLEDRSTFFISTLGINNDSCRITFLEGLNELRKRFPLSQYICVGQKIVGMQDDICVVSYEETFGNKSNAYLQKQIKLFNWDGTYIQENREESL